MSVEFLDSGGQWHSLPGASLIRIEPGVYEVTVTGLAAMWLASPGAFDGMLLRLDGRETKAIVNAQRAGETVVLTAFVEHDRPHF